MLNMTVNLWRIIHDTNDEGASTSATVIVLGGTASYLAIVRGFAPENLNDPSLFVNADGLI
jgi:hypothetical protein